jgi:hypothetical protein
MAEPIDELQATLDALLVKAEQETQLAVLEGMAAQQGLIERLTTVIGKLIAEVSLMEARISMLEADDASV